MLEVDGEVELIVNDNIEVITDNRSIAIAEGTDALEITVNRQEYNIVGDELYIPKRYEDAPTWLQNLITQVVDTSISAKIQDLNEISMSLESMIDAMEVAKNTYELSVISSNDIDERINTAVTTLNSNMNESDATILEVAQTRTTPEEAATITIDVISAQLGSTDAGTIGASVSELQTAIADESEARSTSLDVLTSSIEGAFDVNATAMDYLNTYVGLDEAGASTGTGLSGYLEGTDGQIGSAGSQLINDISLKAGEVQNKFAYNSNVTLNGVTHNSGFGIATTINSSSIPEGDSQFWVSANEFKVVGANQTADAQGPFTVNTTTGDITFRGKVTFNSVNEVYESTITDNTLANNDLFAQRLGYMNYADMVAAATAGQTIINGGYLRGELIEANSINAGQIDAYAITGKQITGGTINGTDINGVRITGAIIKASYIDYTTNLALSNYQEFKFSGSPQIPVDNITINSWSYSGSTVTCTVGSGLIESSYHIRKGNTVLIQNLSCTTNPPNGEYVITEVDYINNTFKFSVVDIPTGTASVSASSKVTSTYSKNFARNSDTTNSLVVDNLGFVRLPAQSGFKTTGTVKTIGGDIAVGGSPYGGKIFNETYNETFGIYPWNDYTVNTLNRAIYPEVNTNYLSGEFKIVTYCTIRNYSYVQGIDGSHNYYDFYIDFLGDTIQGHAYINTNTSGTDSWRAWVVNGVNVGSSYSKTVKGITYMLSSEFYWHVYQNPNQVADPVYYGYGWKFIMTADFTGNKTITSYNFNDLIKLTRSEGLLYATPDDLGKYYVCMFKHDLKYPVLNVQ